MAKLDTLTLRVADPEGQRRFYRDILGMSDRGDGRVGYADCEAAIRFIPAEAPYRPQSSDLYWKIALAVPNIQLACAQLRARGIAASAPVQFRDVGYLAKFADPEGFSIELIDHWFQGEGPERELDETRLGGGAHLNLVTLRSGAIAPLEPVFLDWGMTPLSVQPVEPYGFTLYFYAFTDEVPPDPDLKAVANRSWVYRRPYTVLEIQHVHALGTATEPAEGEAGYAGLTLSSPETGLACPRLKIGGVPA